jgi:hypothetical protein
VTNVKQVHLDQDMAWLVLQPVLIVHKDTTALLLNQPYACSALQACMALVWQEQLVNHVQWDVLAMQRLSPTAPVSHAFLEHTAM